VYTVSVLLPVAYIIGLFFTLKTHSHIYDIHLGEGHGREVILCLGKMVEAFSEVSSMASQEMF